MTTPVWHSVELYAVREFHPFVGERRLELSLRLLLALMSAFSPACFVILSDSWESLEFDGVRRDEERAHMSSRRNVLLLAPDSSLYFT